MSLVVGLTGGIASGKSTVSKMFAKRGAKIVDADEIARNVVEPGTPGLEKIVETFGSHLLDGTHLNREALGAIVFSDENARKRLNAIIHPLVRQEMHRQTDLYRKHQEAVVIWDVPLLYESQLTEFVKKVIVVYVPKEVQLERLQKRNQLTETEALQRIQAQMSIEEKRQIADYVIDNQGSLSSTESQVDRLWNYLKSNSGFGHL
ncbi:dephospho-CoA kinase [Risungbinella massiliensis]|uniref:dephospho-CoA kinase n=1 Tax=Risungbinella massiliensis TaxID=1329796 RepID=UPI0005CBB6E5|nr:dephospho-CoA kinase [Risungbinella massiliensis]